MKKDRYPYSNDPGVFRTGAYIAAMAIIMVKLVAALCRIVVKTVDGIADSRSTRA
jgi:hypothetical protein